MSRPSIPTAKQAAEEVASGKASALDLAKSHLKRIESLDGKIHAFLSVDEKGALAQAEEVDRRVSNGEKLPLAGVPFGIKDALVTGGWPTTAGSKILEGWVPPGDGTAVARLKAAGAVILGKNNMDEFAMGSSTENSAYGPTLNPWDLGCVPGGSSGGSAAAVAAGLGLASLGSDTGGSIRQPAAFCGVTGLKPTYGRVSRYGLIAFASSLDQIGPLCRDAKDAALILSVLAGPDPMDATTVDRPLGDWDETAPVKGLKAAVLPQGLLESCEPDVKKCYLDALDKLWGCGLVESDAEPFRTSPEAALAAYYLVAPSEASSNLSRYDGVRYGLRVPGEDVGQMMGRSRARGFGAEVKRRIMIGTYALSAGYYDAYYGKALQARRLLYQEFEELFSQCDALAIPTTPTTAFALGERTEDPLSMYLGDLFTVSVNLAGLPGISIPCGLDARGRPVGLQIIAPAFEEARLLAIAEAFQSATDHHLAIPKGYEL